MTSITDLLVTQQPLATGAWASFDYDEKLAARFRLMDRFENPYLLYKSANGKLFLPRAVCPMGVEDRRVTGQKFDIPLIIGPRNEEQDEAIVTMYEYFQQDKSGILQAGTGVGKTFMGIALAALLGVQTLVVVTKDDLFDQWIEAIKKFTGLKSNQIGRIRQDTCNVVGKPISVAMIHSLAKEGKYPDFINKLFGFVIYDECLHPSHDVLTTDGWVPVADITEQHRVAQFDPESGEISFDHPVSTIAKPFNGKLVNLKGRSYDMLVTPGHEQPIKRRCDAGWVHDRVTFGAMPHLSRVKLPVSGRGVGSRGITPLDRLWIMFQADGHHLYTGKKCGQHTLRFSFRRQRKIDRCRWILESCGFNYKEKVNKRGDTNFTVKVDKLPPKHLSWADLEGGADYAQSFLDEVMEWDGHIRSDGGCEFDTDVLECAEVVQILASLCGHQASYKKYTTGYGADNYRVLWFGSRSWVQPRGYAKSDVSYGGMVYCVTMPMGNIVTRRNGCVAITGNCHRVSADTFMSVAGMFASKWRLGLSATTDRSDGKQIVFLSHIGPIRHVIEGVPMVPKVFRYRTNYSLPRVPRTINGKRKIVPLPHQAGKIAHVVSHMAKDEERNKLISKLASMAYKKGNRVVLFSDQIEHLQDLEGRLLALGVKSSDLMHYAGAMKKEAKVAALSKRFLLATPGKAGEGTDLVDYDCVILSTPRSDIRQLVGRVLREKEGKNTPIVIDLMDEDSSVFQGYANKRLAYYHEMGAEVTDVF